MRASRNSRTRRRRRAAAHAPEGRRRRRAVHGGQRRAVFAGGEVARPHGLERADCLALGPGRRPLQRTRRTERPARALHPDLQLLRQALAQGRGRARRAEEEISRDQGARRRDARGRHRQRLRCDEPDDARDRQGRFDRRPEDPRGVLRARQVRGPDQDLQQAVHAGEPRCACRLRTTSSPTSRKARSFR